MSIKLAVAGFRHAHIFDLYQRAIKMDGIEIVAACETDPAVREAILSERTAEITHDDFGAMLAEVD